MKILKKIIKILLGIAMVVMIVIGSAWLALGWQFKGDSIRDFYSKVIAKEYVTRKNSDVELPKPDICIKKMSVDWESPENSTVELRERVAYQCWPSNAKIKNSFLDFILDRHTVLIVSTQPYVDLAQILKSPSDELLHGVEFPGALSIGYKNSVEPYQRTVQHFQRDNLNFYLVKGKK